MRGVAGTPWVYRSLLLPIRSHKNGSTRDLRSPSSRMASKAPLKRQRRSQGTRASLWAPPVSCSSASGWGFLRSYTSTWYPSCWGDGVRLFDHLGTEPIELESTRVIEGAGVTHLTFRVVKEN